MAEKKITESFINGLKSYQKRVDLLLDKYGLPALQMEIISLLGKNDCEYQQNELAEKVGVDKATMSVSLRLLEREGFVARQVNPRDKRAMNVSLTSAGWIVYSRWLDDQQLIMRRIFPIKEDKRIVSEFINDFEKTMEVSYEKKL